VPPPLNPADVRKHLAADSPPWDLAVFESVDSTMDRARALLAEGRRPPLAVFAAEQTAGRGRRGRLWEAPAGTAVLLTAAVSPAGLRPGEPAASFLGAVAAAECARALGVPARTKWPNDVLVGPPWRKLAGVLVEQYRPAAEAPVFLLGLGLNVNDVPPAVASPPPIRPTSIYTETGRHTPIAVASAALLNALAAGLSALRAGGPPAVYEAWDRLSMMREAPLEAATPEGRFACRFLGLTNAGDARVRLADQSERTLQAARTDFYLAGSGGRTA
jgi:BirA family biotin operon repressor/biotin-[acetyl-CoA-carboxylase] ligase